MKKSRCQKLEIFLFILVVASKDAYVTCETKSGYFLLNKDIINVFSANGKLQTWYSEKPHFVSN